MKTHSYIARVRFYGSRDYKVVKRTDNFVAAVKAMTTEFADMRAYKRGDVLQVSAPPYDPIQLVEIVRK